MEQKTSGDTVPYFIVWQSLIWARFTLVSPFLTALILVTLYTLGFRNWALFIDTILIMGSIVIVVWWFWVIYTIATIAYMIEKSSGRIKDVLIDIQDMKKEIQSFEYKNKE